MSTGNSRTTINQQRRVNRARRRQKIARLKESQPCKDCGFFFPAPIMEFDHRPGEKKVDTVSRMIAEERKWDIIENEIKKCDLVCANCHRYRTHCCRQTTLTPQKEPLRALVVSA